MGQVAASTRRRLPQLQTLPGEKKADSAILARASSNKPITPQYYPLSRSRSTISTLSTLDSTRHMGELPRDSKLEKKMCLNLHLSPPSGSPLSSSPWAAPPSPPFAPNSPAFLPTTSPPRPPAMPSSPKPSLIHNPTSANCWASPSPAAQSSAISGPPATPLWPMPSPSNRIVLFEENALKKTTIISGMLTVLSATSQSRNDSYCLFVISPFATEKYKYPRMNA
jgi:hypothetical protein